MIHCSIWDLIISHKGLDRAILQMINWKAFTNEVVASTTINKHNHWLSNGNAWNWNGYYHGVPNKNSICKFLQALSQTQTQYAAFLLLAAVLAHQIQSPYITSTKYNAFCSCQGIYGQAPKTPLIKSTFFFCSELNFSWLANIFVIMG